MFALICVAILAVLYLRPDVAAHGKYLGGRLLNEIEGFLESDPEQSLSDIPFEYIEIDPIAGDIKMVGDIDGDDLPDLVIGGMPSEGLNWYRYPGWNKTNIAVPMNEFTTDGSLGDIDSDGDLDIVTPDGDTGDNLVWFENPLPDGDPSVGSQWQRHTVGSIGSWGKDIELADFDGNDRLDIATRNQSQAMIFFQTGDDAWEKMEFSGLITGSEGLASGDIDDDGFPDLVLQGVWIRNPGGDSARTPIDWNQYTIGEAHPDFKALVVDLNLDGVVDVLFSSSEGTADVDWWTPTSGDPTESWTKHTIVPSLDRAHTLQAADMDLDGDIDVVVGQMHTSSKREIRIYFNDGGDALNWSMQVVGNNGIHNGVVADIGSDGDFDIYGANWTGNPPVQLWENRLDSLGVLDRWTYKQISDSHSQTFGLAFGDLNNDNRLDIASGRYWYANPGSDLLDHWEQHTFPEGMEVFLVSDVDGDEFVDVFAQKDEGDIAIYWLEAQEINAISWKSIFVGSVPGASHALGAQGYRSAQIETGGLPEILITSGNGIYYFHIPEDPDSGNWPKIHVNSNPSDEGFSIGDIDRDGNLDIAGTTGDSKRVEWYKNPGNGNAEWIAYVLGTFEEAVFPDRIELADFNGDNRLDVVVTEENGVEQDADTYWWAQPDNVFSGNWARQLIVTQATTNSLDVADMNQDDYPDVILAEHRGTKKVAVWVNNGSGQFSEVLVDAGKESHLGAQVVDLDGDGDFDIVSIAWDLPGELHLWRNDQTGGTIPSPTPPPQPTPPPSSGRFMNGLVVWYKFQEGSGGTIFDQSGLDTLQNLKISNMGAVQWLQDGGLKIKSPVVIATDDVPVKVVESCQANNEITLEAWLTPENTTMNGPARILTLSDDAYNRNFTLGQEYDVFDVRLRTTSTSDNGMPSLSSPVGAVDNELTHIVYVRKANGSAQIYKNGNLISSGQVDGDFSNWSEAYRLGLVNEFSDDRHWMGILFMVAIYCQALIEAQIDQNFLSGPFGDQSALQYLPLLVKSSGNFKNNQPGQMEIKPADNLPGEFQNRSIGLSNDTTPAVKFPIENYLIFGAITISILFISWQIIQKIINFSKFPH